MLIEQRLFVNSYENQKGRSQSKFSRFRFSYSFKTTKKQKKDTNNNKLCVFGQFVNKAAIIYMCMSMYVFFII